jgi:hypothetical protein
MKQPIELGIMVVMAAMMVFATTAYVMPSVYAATSSSGQGAACDPSSCKGTPGYYTTSGHHHCFDGSPGCKCTDPHKCTVGSVSTKPGSDITKPGSASTKPAGH